MLLSVLKTQFLLDPLSENCNSWALGGIAAATQTVDGFMEGAAKKIAKEVSEAKANGKKENVVVSDAS